MAVTKGRKEFRTGSWAKANCPGSGITTNLSLCRSLDFDTLPETGSKIGSGRRRDRRHTHDLSGASVFDNRAKNLMDEAS